MRLLVQTDLFALLNLLHMDRGQNALTDSFHLPICNFIQTTPYPTNLYMLQRGAFKTSVITAGRNIQRIIKNPEVRILIASNKSENAEAMLEELKGHLAHPYMVWLFPDILWRDPEREAARWTRSAITVKRKRRDKEPTVETIGVSGELTSKHYDHGTFDDVVGRENSQTRDLLLDTISFYRSAASLFDPGATIDVVGTPWHYADLYAWLLDQKDHHGMKLGVYTIPCWLPDPTGQEVPYFGRVRPTFPERFPVDELLRIRAIKGSSEFAAQYLLNPVSADTAVFARERLQILPRAEMPPTDSLWCVMTVDPAISTKAWADYSAVAVVGFSDAGMAYILDLRRGKWPEDELIAQVYDSWGRVPNIRAIGIEATGFQKIFQRLFAMEGERRGQFLPILRLERDTKITKNIRIRGLQPPWERGHIVSASDCPALPDLLDEADRFRTDRESTHDDLLDVLVDSFQLRARPSPPQAPERFLDDPEMADRRAWEQQMMQAKPWLDRTALRVGWSTHQHFRMRELEREAAVLGAGKEEFWS